MDHLPAIPRLAIAGEQRQSKRCNPKKLIRYHLPAVKAKCENDKECWYADHLSPCCPSGQQEWERPKKK